jgi:AcrR family transcriptional regulator
MATTGLQSPGAGDRPAKYQRRYAEMLDAAAAVFADRGYHGASTKDIADRLGIKQGSIYYYFTSKQDALAEVCAIGVEGFVGGIRAIMAESFPVADKVRAAIHSHIYPMEERGDYTTVFLRERKHLTGDHRRRVGAASREYEDCWLQLIRDGKKRGTFKAGIDEQVAVFAILGQCNSAVDWLGTRVELPAKVVAQQIANLVLDGLCS